MNLNPEIAFIKRVGHQERLLFTKHLATMVKAGIPIAEAIDTLIEQTDAPYFRSVQKSVLDDINNGKSMADSLKKFPKVFDQFYISLVEIGEESGTLEENLEFLAQQLSKDYNLRKKIQGAMMYPLIVLAATLIMGGFISFYVLPKLVEFFKSFDVELPFTTKILIVFANLMKNYGALIFVGLIVCIIGLRLVLNSKSIKPHWHSLILKLPLLGPLLLNGQLARFSRNLGTLVKSGVPIVRGLEITSDTISNLRFKNDLMTISKSLSKGKNIGETMKKGKYTEFPPLVSRMIAIGEKTGKLDESLLYLSSFYDDEVDDMSKNFSTILEPILLVTIGLVVGFIALSIISPIYQLTGSIRR
jgi:type IV pilus assembly protein PilC